MKKKWVTKPVLSILAAATIAGGVTPAVLANSDNLLQLTGGSKVVMNDEGRQVTRYHLKTLVENDPAQLDLLLKLQAEHLYLIVPELDLEVKWTDFIESDKEEWERIYRDHFEDIYLEVRADAEDEAEGFVSVKQETKGESIYITGEVADDVTKVTLTTTTGDKVEVVPTEANSFTLTIPATLSATPQYVTLRAYEGSKLVETEILRVNAGTVEEEDVIVHALATYVKEKDQVKVRGVVDADADEVVVRYDGKTKEAELTKLWNGAESFTVTFDADVDAEKQVVVEAYVDDKKVDTATAEIIGLSDQDDQDDQEDRYTITASASFSAKAKVVNVKGSIGGDVEADDKLKLVVTAPDGKQQEVKLEANGSFNANIDYKNRSFSSKVVRLSLYSGDKLVAQADIPYGKPVNNLIIHPVPVKPVLPVKVELKPEVKVELKVEGKVEGKGKGKPENHPGKGQGNKK